MRTYRPHSSLWLLLATGLLAAGCDIRSSGSDVDPTEPVVGAEAAQLHRALSCEDLEASLKQDALAKMNAQIDAMIAGYASYGLYPQPGVPLGANDVPTRDTSADPTSAPAPAPPGGGSASGEGAANDSAGPSHSETNTQVAGVDEADIVKTDGENVYLLHGQSFYTLSAWPASSLAIGSSIAIEGEPFEMFVTGQKVVVYSSVNGASIYERAGVEPRPEYYDYGIGYGIALPARTDTAPAGAPASPSGNGGDATPPDADDPPPASDSPSSRPAPPPPDGGDSEPSSDGGDSEPPPDAPADPSEPGFDAPPPDQPLPPDQPTPVDAYVPLTKITVLSLAAGSPNVVRELYFEGGYSSSRRAGDHVRTVLVGGAHGPSLRYAPQGLKEYPSTAEAWTAAFEQLRAENTATINEAPLSTWMPYRFEKRGEAVTELGVRCEDFYIPGAGTTSYGLTQIESIDLAAPEAPPASTSIIGATDTVYASHDALYVAARGWNQPVLQGDRGETLESVGATHLHKFDLTADPSRPRYAASGSVPGHILNQFSLDEQDGKIRVSTTEQLASATEWTTTNNVFVLEERGDDLAPVGAVRDLARGETIQSTRFVGNTGYVVTFRRVDPLFVIDLATPSSPAVVGELKIPGFSEYMHPIDDGHLLTIGRDATDEGRALGLALQIFDVTDPSAPALLHKETVGSQFTHSEAEHNHKAFTYDGERGVLAVPLSSYDPNTGAISSTLELFRATVDDGFSRLGAVDHSAFFSATPEARCYAYSPDVRRGLFIEDHVVSISYGGVITSALDDLATPVASLPLPAPYPSWGACGDVAQPAPPPPDMEE